ncbi:MAG TPA: M1 family metallopeptidase [Flavobacteriaceae bacterium]|nr:M1 family metallopeptidase [Flavobacteriaceae bacterium]
MNYFLSILFFVFSVVSVQSQILNGEKPTYSRADSLRGGLRPERTNFDVLKYDLTLKVLPQEKFITGYNEITFEVKHKLETMQIDLFENMQVDSILHNGKKLEYEREFNAVFIQFEAPLKKNTVQKIKFYYSGNPIVAEHAPWDGGFVFTKDSLGNPWISTAVQGIGASLWYPNKDTQSDEPDQGAELHIAVPNGLMDVSNGRLIGKKDLGNGFTQWNWKVVNPINNYSLSLNIGNYVHFSGKYKTLDLNYWVLPQDLEKAKKQFTQVIGMMDCFYEHFGAYPFIEDGFKLVQTPYLGMEHQSAVAYGNHFENGYLGRDLSHTGIGLKFDFIIIHESGHEWFGNSITASDIADMWIHESFTTYAESVYVECQWGKEEALEYLYGIRKNIQNKAPIIGDYGVNSEGSGDMYYKGANLLNTLRSIVDDDEKWWSILREYSLHFRHKIIEAEDVIDFFEKKTGRKLEPVFDQYLRFAEIPELQFKKEDNRVYFRWETDVKKFKMPVDILLGGKEIRIFPKTKWRKLKISPMEPKEIVIDTLGYYIKSKTIEH